ncbi:hypothetical protein [Sphingomonas jaspsi]|uniref:hypothetical protein n=1 Tax=Sphingomonas jaspsi TaxID=392409 RepID=UPI0004ACEAC5|nr:hypothetical protein [Sphingomonas jaspsi]
MNRYYIECHEDGEMLATSSFTITARGPAEAKRKAAQEMRLAYGREDTPLREYLDDQFHLDSCTELEDGLPFQSPVQTAIEALVGTPAGRQLDRWYQERCDIL